MSFYVIQIARNLLTSHDRHLVMHSNIDSNISQIRATEILIEL